jgi:NADPH2:quinone reductase
MAWGVGGWLLTPFLRKAGPSVVAAMRERVAAGITTTFASSYIGRLSLVEALQPEAVAAYARMSTGSKYLITPHGTS